MKNILVPLALGAVIVFGMYACNTSNTTGDGGGGPVITSQPRDTTVALGDMASFTLTATNALSYKWIKNNTDTVSINLPILAFSGVQASDTGAYKCVVENLTGTTVSNAVYLHIGSSSTGTNPPTITSQPQDFTVLAGGTTTFSVTATGAGTLTYQWVKGAVNLTGKTSSTLTLSNVSATDTGAYKCVVSNSTGSVASNTARLHIGSSGSSHASLQMSIDVLSNTAPTGSTPGKLVTRSIQSSCDSTHVVTDTSIDTSFYSIAGGKLYLWSEGDCVAGSMSGSSTTLVGAWTSTDVIGGNGNPGERVLVPAAYRASTCPSTLPPDSSSNQELLIMNATSTLTISASRIDIQESGDICFAEQIYGDSANTPFGPTINVTSASCSSVQLTNITNQRTLTASSSFQNNNITFSLASGGTTCTSTMPLNLPGTTPDCSQNTYAADTAYSNCVYSLEMGLMSTPSAKVSASASSHHPWWKRH